MKVNVYTKDDMVKNIELNVSVAEFFAIQKALCVYAGNSDMPVESKCPPSIPESLTHTQ